MRADALGAVVQKNPGGIGADRGGGKWIQKKFTQ